MGAFDPKRKLLVIVSGYSGAGLTTALHALQDNGFFCIDNLPIELLDQATKFIEDNGRDVPGFAIAMDIRSEGIIKDFAAIKARLGQKLNLDILFLTADKDHLAERFNTTRRKHPLMGESLKLMEAIQKEMELLEPVKLEADCVFDTSTWSPHYLSRTIEKRFSGKIPERQLNVVITSFGFKNGLLRPVDSLFDVRFLLNPYFDPRLKEKTGLEAEVAGFIEKDPRVEVLLNHLVNLHKFLLPQYFSEGKNYCHIGIGCTGGKHRSVYIAEELGKSLRQAGLEHISITVSHRDLKDL